MCLGMTTHQLPGEGMATPSLASCLDQLNSQMAWENGAGPAALFTYWLPWRFAILQGQGVEGDGEVGGWHSTGPGKWGRGPTIALHVP